MLIKYTPKTKHIKCVPLVTTDNGIKLTRSQVELSPGINEVSEDEWAVMKTILVDDSEITVVKTEVKSSAEKPKHIRALRDVSPAHALGIVKNCSSGKTLKKWYRTETREFVLLAILKQLKKLNIDPFENTDDEPVLDKVDTGEDDKDPDPDDGKEDNGKILDKMTKEELLAFAKEKGITVAGNKDEILTALKAVVANEGGAQ
ncbi:MAG: SAP domain-containing protein [Treponema sp.]|nr:SAP domain-containing protein [Treponema sp.]